MPEEGTESTEQSPSANLEALITKLNADFDKRFQGVQSLLDRRDAEYRTMLEDAQAASLSPEEQDQVQASKLQQQIAEYKRQISILEKRPEYPEEVDLLTALLKGDSLESQLELLSKFRKAEAAAQPSSDEGSDEATTPTPVDANNPKRKSELSLADLSAGMNAELSDKILSTQGNEPGVLRRLREVVTS